MVGKQKNALYRISLSAMFMAVGIILPFFTGQVQHIGNMLLPMHLPVLLCGLICGWQYGGVVGFTLPLIRSLMLGMPPIFPNAVGMAVELLTYGIVVGLVYSRMKKQGVLSVIVSLIFAMVMGRIVWGITQTVLLSLTGGVFTWRLFLAGAFVNAVPGIILQLVLIPAIMSVLHFTRCFEIQKRIGADERDSTKDNHSGREPRSRWHSYRFH